MEKFDHLESFLLRINSHEKNPDSASNSDYTMSFGNAARVQRVCNVVIKSVDIPNVFYNIRNDRISDNEDFTYKVGGVPTTVTVPVGQYQILDPNPVTNLLEVLAADALLRVFSMSNLMSSRFRLLRCAEGFTWESVPFPALTMR